MGDHPAPDLQTKIQASNQRKADFWGGFERKPQESACHFAGHLKTVRLHVNDSLNVGQHLMASKAEVRTCTGHNMVVVGKHFTFLLIVV